MKPLSLSNNHFAITIDPQTGGIARIAHPHDVHKMNWVCSPQENSWFPNSHSWGLGYISTPRPDFSMVRWQVPESITSKGPNKCVISYINGNTELRVTRILVKDRFEEQFELINRSKQELPLWGMAIYAPFNDNYPNAATCITQRCNAHIWCGGNVAYVNCMRMGGAAPHLGLILTQGTINGYSIEDRGALHTGSNARGSILFNVSGCTLKPGKTLTLAWSMFWHTGHNDFFDKAAAFPSFARLQAEEYLLVKGKVLNASILPGKGRTISKVLVDGSPIKPKEHGNNLVFSKKIVKAGEHQVEAHDASGWKTLMRVYATDPLKELLVNRARFIIKNQMVTDKHNPFYGALLPYDRLTKTIQRNPEGGNVGEGQERIGMGIFLAYIQQRWPFKENVNALKLYHWFIRTKLQFKDGSVIGELGGNAHRLYNYPWAAHFHLEMYKTFGDKKYLHDFLATMNSYYKRGGNRFYAIDLPLLIGVETLREAGMTKEADVYCKKVVFHADTVLANGLNYPVHEVHYEQTIVGPGAHILLDAYMLTHNKKYLDEAKRQLMCLESFNGRQPDYHLHDIAIRHWDGYWFSRSGMWGDTMPHYWSALTGFVFYRYWQITGNEAYRKRGRRILMNNLCSFFADGSASCAYMYPDSVNGNAGRFWDTLANDQDYALVFLMEAGRIDPEFVRECW